MDKLSLHKYLIIFISVARTWIFLRAFREFLTLQLMNLLHTLEVAMSGKLFLSLNTQVLQ